LWQTFSEVFPDRVTLLHFELERLCTPAPETVYEQRALHVAQLLAPRDFLTIAARLSPEGQGRRRADVRAFEEGLLSKVDSAGHWR
jgi:hypothetical protein